MHRKELCSKATLEPRLRPVTERGCNLGSRARECPGSEVGGTLDMVQEHGRVSMAGAERSRGE